MISVITAIICEVSIVAEHENAKRITNVVCFYTELK